MSNITRHIGKRGTNMAVACALAIVGSLEAMYIVDRDVKVHEGQFSPFEDEGHAAMSSAEVSDAVSIPNIFSRVPRLHVHPAPVHPA